MARTTRFELLLANLAPTLAKEGFTRAKAGFSSSSDESWALVRFQRGSRSVATTTVLTIDLGVASKALLKFFGKPPAFESCHWNQRIGFAMPSAQDKWWHLTDDNISEISRDILDALVKYGLPAVARHRSDMSLIDSWREGVASGLTEVDRLRFLSALLMIHGNTKEANSIASELVATTHGRPTEGVAHIHNQKLASWTSHG